MEISLVTCERAVDSMTLNYYKDPDIKPKISLTSQQLIKFAQEIADGMSYLSSRSVS